MNKHILKLLGDAGFHQPEMERLGIEDKFEKFAELIAREYGNIVLHYTDVDEGVKVANKHFGVEE